MHPLTRVCALAAFTALGASSGCDDLAQYRDQTYPVEADAGADAGIVEPGDGDGGAPVGALSCRNVAASEALPARGSVMTRPATSMPVGVSVDDLYEQFRSHCAGCHVDADRGGLKVKRDEFSVKITAEALRRLRSDDPAQVMPPGKPFGQRDASDPVVGFAKLLEVWLDQGRPADVFYPPADGASADTPYFLPERVGMQMTNLGNCVPSRTGFASETERSLALDAMWEKATELPERLEQTDLFTLDAKELARYGVVAYAPAYTLWADNAKKMRMIRVPRGTSITFDKTTQTFDLPANTRVYKTFFKRVIDKDGSERYRKMETRLIVTRPDADDSQGVDRSRALFGTYAWNEQETEAVLVRDPLRNGKPFRDRVITYYVNEQRVDELIRDGEPNLEDKLQAEKLARKYAIPGSERCIHCHMGAPMRDFVLGFSPLQIMRRPVGEGGVIEPAADDELNQLQRFLDYGLITGMASPSDVAPLEASQGDRTPRNDHELVAQGYVLGNCAHCHNPRGFPSTVAPELKELLDMAPSQAGGLFQFPLERFSPRIYRGQNQDLKIPYITPSLYDVPGSYDGDTKVVMCEGDIAPQRAPWRSLIYRNVATPFSYDDDFTIFPHMPQDTPGYDCRAQQLLGTWMTSIPARLKDSTVPAFSGELPVPDPALYPEAYITPADPGALAQPYVEVRPDDPAYRSAVTGGLLRVEKFRASPRYQTCPDPAQDIIDPEVAQGDAIVPAREESFERDGCTVAGGTLPERGHFFVMDRTEVAADWAPRRSDWLHVLKEGNVPQTAETTRGQERNRQNRQTVRLLTGRDPWRKLPDRAADVRFSEQVRTFALSAFPFGLWQAKPECTLRDVPSAASYTGDARPHWFADGGPGLTKVPEDAAVYTTAPGAQVFNSICSNCHGPLADSRGRMATLVADLTGGTTMVANLRDGIFGPALGSGAGAPGDNRAVVFGQAVDAFEPLTAEDWAARYLLWMGLGGTEREIPPAVLNVVANTRVLGVPRQGLEGLGDVGANMLAVAEFLCAQSLPFDQPYTREFRFDVAEGGIDDYEKYPPRSRRAEDGRPPLALMSVNGDAELWEQLCSLDNPAPVRAVHFAEGRFTLVRSLQRHRDLDGVALDNTGQPTNVQVPLLLRREDYPPSTPVGDQRGRVSMDLGVDNLAPWCVVRPDPANSEAMLRAYVAARAGDASPPPYCPDELVRGEAHWFDDASSHDWSRRGAMNAGLSVFAYLDALANGRRPDPSFDHCEELP